MQAGEAGRGACWRYYRYCMLRTRLALVIALLWAAGGSAAQGRIEVKGAVAAPVQVSLDAATQLFHYAGCPHVSAAMPRLAVPVARLKGFRPDPDCVHLAPKPVVRKEAVARGDEAIDVLFIGNSLTFFNELPWMLEQLAAARGVKLRAVFEGSSGDDLKQHWDRGKALARIREGRWDWVVLQDQSRAPVLKPDVLPAYAPLFDAEIRKAGARTLLFLTWAHSDRPSEQTAITRSYERTAASLRANVAPVGIVWDRLRGRMRLFDGSTMHPNVTGTYLAACVFFSVITGQSPVGLPHRFDVRFDIQEFYRASLEHDSIGPVHAAAIQRAVWDEVRRRSTR